MGRATIPVTPRKENTMPTGDYEKLQDFTDKPAPYGKTAPVFPLTEAEEKAAAAAKAKAEAKKPAEADK